MQYLPEHCISWQNIVTNFLVTMYKQTLNARTHDSIAQ